MNKTENKTSEAQLKAIKNWRVNNREKYNEKARVFSTKYYNENREKILEKKRTAYHKKKLLKEEIIIEENSEDDAMFAEIIDELEADIAAGKEII